MDVSETAVVFIIENFCCETKISSVLPRTAKWLVPARVKTALVLTVADGRSQIRFEVNNMDLAGLIKPLLE